MKKKIISALLVFVMVLSAAPLSAVTAYAAAAPVVTTTPGTTSFTENQIALVIDSGITAITDSTAVSNATVTISDNFHSVEDMLMFTNADPSTYGNISASYDSDTGILTMTSSGATATLAQWQAALRAVKYKDTSEGPSAETRTISFVVSDDTQSSTAATKTVSVTAVNDTPSVAENAATGTEVCTLTATDSNSSSLYNPTRTGYTFVGWYTDAAFTGAAVTTINDILADGVSIGTVSSYTFQYVKKAHTISVSFEKKKTGNPFADVKDGDWFHDSVLYVYQKGLMSGTGPDTFSPDGTMSRAMAAVVLFRLSGDTGSYPNVFSDVPSGAWYEKAAAWAVAKGISGGVGDNRFSPEAVVDREQLAAMLWRYAKYKGYDVSIGENTNILSYNDALDISDYAYPALQWACGAGIMNGDLSGNLAPRGFVTRAQVAKMITVFMQNVIGS